MLWYTAEITLKSISVYLIPNFPRIRIYLPHINKIHKKNKVCTLRLPRYASYMQETHIYSFFLGPMNCLGGPELELSLPYKMNAEIKSDIYSKLT